MDMLLTLVGKIGCVLEHEQGLDRNLLHTGKVSLEGAEVVFDRDILAYSTAKNPGLIRYYGNPPLIADRKEMPRRRIIGIKNPDLVLLLVPDGWFSVETKTDLLSLEDYSKQHERFLKHVGRYGFVHERDKIVSIFQELVDRECDIYEEIISKYDSL